jgi:hypothetical protein
MLLWDPSRAALTDPTCSHSIHINAGASLYKFTVVTRAIQLFTYVYGPRWRSWLRYCATNRKVAGSIPDGVRGFFHWHNPSGRTMALGSTQPPTEMSTRNISWGVKAARAYG